MSSWNPELYSLVPRDTGADPNDYTTRSIILPSPMTERSRRPGGGRRTCSIMWRFSSDSGSGSNTWLCAPVFVRNPEEAADSWDVFDPPQNILAVNVCPVIFSDTDLTLTRVYEVPLRMDRIALRLTRSGAGTHVLLVEGLVSAWYG